MKLQSDKTQINALTSTRAIAAIMVVIHHYASIIYPFNLSSNLFQSGNLAVSYFFVLSGFVLYVAHIDRPLNYTKYFVRRLVRILPLYYIALALMVGLLLIQHNIPANMGSQVLYSALLVQSYVPGYALTLNLPAWSISVEMLFYLLFPFLLPLLKNKPVLFVVLWFILYSTSVTLHQYYFPQRHQLPDCVVDPLFFGPYIHVSQFMTGMIGGYLFSHFRYRPEWPWYVPPLVTLVAILLIAFRPADISYHVGLIAPVFMLLILTIAKVKAPLLNIPFFIFLGEISYCIYILQYPVFTLTGMLNTHSLHLGNAAYFYSSLVVLVILSSVLYTLVEQPIRKYIRRHVP